MHLRLKCAEKYSNCKRKNAIEFHITLYNIQHAIKVLHKVMLSIWYSPEKPCSVSGNRLLHNLTSSRNCSLRIDMEDFEGEARFALYTEFKVGSEEDGFRLTAGGYSGNAGLHL